MVPWKINRPATSQKDRFLADEGMRDKGCSQEQDSPLQPSAPCRGPRFTLQRDKSKLACTTDRRERRKSWACPHRYDDGTDADREDGAELDNP